MGDPCKKIKDDESGLTCSKCGQEVDSKTVPCPNCNHDHFKHPRFEE